MPARQRREQPAGFAGLLEAERCHAEHLMEIFTMSRSTPFEEAQIVARLTVLERVVAMMVREILLDPSGPRGQSELDSTR